jgi:endonuclease YncB( thermonuclease family)
MYPLRAGTSVMSAARSTDGRWIIALTEDGRAAYLPADDLGPYDPNRAPGPEQPPPVSGEAQVVDTGTLIVNGQRLALAGVEGEGGEYARQLQSLIASQGGTVTCTPQGRGFVCQLANGMDIARAALYNGAARAADDASDDYRQQAESARSGRRGIWR